MTWQLVRLMCARTVISATEITASFFCYPLIRKYRLERGPC